MEPEWEVALGKHLIELIRAESDQITTIQDFDAIRTEYEMPTSVTGFAVQHEDGSRYVITIQCIRETEAYLEAEEHALRSEPWERAPWLYR
jgi:hypothetical protein